MIESGPVCGRPAFSPGPYLKYSFTCHHISMEKATSPYKERTMTTEDRVLNVIIDIVTPDYVPTAWDVAEVMVDQDVSDGDYEGCSSDLEMAFNNYEAVAQRVLDELEA